MSMEIGNLGPLRTLAADLDEWHGKAATRANADKDDVTQTLVSVRQQLASALESAANIEIELSAAQYAKLRGMKLDTLYKRWQRGKLPEAHMNGGKLVVPVSALMADAA